MQRVLSPCNLSNVKCNNDYIVHNDEMATVQIREGPESGIRKREEM